MHVAELEYQSLSIKTLKLSQVWSVFLDIGVEFSSGLISSCFAGPPVTTRGRQVDSFYSDSVNDCCQNVRYKYPLRLLSSSSIVFNGFKISMLLGQGRSIFKTIFTSNECNSVFSICQHQQIGAHWCLQEKRQQTANCSGIWHRLCVASQTVVDFCTMNGGTGPVLISTGFTLF